MKALILAAGRGKRLGDRTTCSNKCLLELGEKPVLSYNLDRAIDLHVSEIILVVGHCAEDIINQYGIRYKETPIRYVIQWEQKGLVHAMGVAKAALEDQDFFLLLGDEILIRSRHIEMNDFFNKEKIMVLCGVFHQKNPDLIQRTYTVLSDESNRVFRLIEKPKKALSNIQGTGHCIFKNCILNYIDRTPIHPERGEKELPDLIQCAVDDGMIVKIFDICDDYSNINTEDDLILAKKMK